VAVPVALGGPQVTPPDFLAEGLVLIDPPIAHVRPLLMQTPTSSSLQCLGMVRRHCRSFDPAAYGAQQLGREQNSGISPNIAGRANISFTLKARNSSAAVPQHWSRLQEERVRWQITSHRGEIQVPNLGIVNATVERRRIMRLRARLVRPARVRAIQATTLSPQDQQIPELQNVGSGKYPNSYPGRLAGKRGVPSAKLSWRRMEPHDIGRSARRLTAHRAIAITPV
jgi:hypothetical protein